MTFIRPTLTLAQKSLRFGLKLGMVRYPRKVSKWDKGKAALYVTTRYWTLFGQLPYPNFPQTPRRQPLPIAAGRSNSLVDASQ